MSGVIGNWAAAIAVEAAGHDGTQGDGNHFACPPLPDLATDMNGGYDDQTEKE
ncbi:MAG: hypothetical protein R3F38_09445 [Gammaproteobacteria bacterium]